MARMVFCRKYQQEMEGLELPPYPGAKGLDILANVSKQAWGEWMAHQTRLINEKHLSVMEMSTKVYLTEQMEKFLSNQDYDKAEGFVPETPSAP